ncbi:MAG TPA: hypothetical protein PLV68_06060, partial [Ilumatobacteraceae bacterium]|nr:hypothetical protein [Ilumatobacteraceae bacterium]
SPYTAMAVVNDDGQLRWRRCLDGESGWPQVFDAERGKIYGQFWNRQHAASEWWEFDVADGTSNVLADDLVPRA